MGNENLSQDIANSGITRRSFLSGLGAGTGYVALGGVNNAGAKGTSAEEAQILIGLEEARPEPKTEGRLYFAMDTGERFYDTGNQWHTLNIAAPVGEFEDLSAEDASIGIYESEFKPLHRPFNSRSHWEFSGWLKDNFEDLSDWDTVSGSVEADTDEVYLADQSARLSASDGPAMIEHSVEGADFSDTDVSLALALNEPDSTNIEVLLHDSAGAYVVYRGPIQANEGWIQSNMGISIRL